MKFWMKLWMKLWMKFWIEFWIKLWIKFWSKWWFLPKIFEFWQKISNTRILIISHFWVFLNIIFIENFFLEIPESISHCSKMVYLDLSHNNISSLPDSFCFLQNLNRLSLNCSNLFTLPRSIGNLQRTVFKFRALLWKIYWRRFLRGTSIQKFNP